MPAKLIKKTRNLSFENKRMVIIEQLVNNKKGAPFQSSPFEG